MLFGILTRFAAFFILVFMIVATVKVHLVKEFFIQPSGFEYNFVLICICLTLIIAGPAKFSIWNK